MQYFFVFLIFLSTAFGKQISPIERKVLDLTGDPVRSDLSLVGADRSEIIDTLKKVITRKIKYIELTPMDPDVARLALIRLGDIPTIESVIEEYQRYNSRRAWQYIPKMMERSRQPILLNYLASDFFSDEHIGKGHTIVDHGGNFAIGVSVRSLYSGGISLKIIQRSPLFSPEVQAWAKDMQIVGFKQPGPFLRMMRAWWNENKEAFEKQDYASVKTIDLAPFISEPEILTPTPPPVPTPDISPTPEVLLIQPTLEPIPQPTETPPSPPASAEEAYPWKWIALVFFSLLTGGVLFFRYSRKNF